MTWTLLTNHAHVLHAVACQPDIRLRDIAERVGITERAVHRIVCDLEEVGYLTRHHVGARNSYEVHATADLAGKFEHQLRVGDVLELLLKDHGKRLPGVTSVGRGLETGSPSRTRNEQPGLVASQGA